MRRILLSAGLASLLIPAAAFALEGIGPRVTITGTVQEVKISDKESFQEYGGQYTVKAQNGQIVTVVLDKDTEIISEGKLSRKYLRPVNVSKNMQVRIRGWRIGSDSLTASLVVIMNIELNPALSLNGTLQSINGSAVTVLTSDGRSSTYNITNETEVNINYSVRGTDGLTLIGKPVLLTLNPLNSAQVRVLRINGAAEPVRTKPSTVELKMR